MRYRIYYADGSTFDGSPSGAPSLGVVCIVQPDPDVGRHVLSGFDYYWPADGAWWGGDLFGLFQYLIEPGLKKVLFGRTISNRAFREILKAACEDRDFAPKSGWKRGERKP